MMIEELAIDRSFPAPGTHLCGMAWDGEYLWHSDGDTNRLYCIDPTTGTIVAEIACPDVRTDLAYDGANLWQIAGHPKRIRIMDPTRSQVRDEIGLGPDAENACGLCVEADRYWIGWKATARIQERSRQGHDVKAEYRALPRIAGLARAGTLLWYTEYEQRLFVGIDLTTGHEEYRFFLPGSPTGLCWDGSRFWYSDYANRRLCAVRIPASL